MAGGEYSCPHCGGKFLIGEPAPPPKPPIIAGRQWPREPEANPIQRMLVAGMIGWSLIGLAHLVYLTIDAAPYFGDSDVSGFIVGSYVRALLIYSVPMAALLLGYIAAKR